MSQQADAWTPGRDEAPASPPAVAPPAPGALPDVVKLFTDTMNDLVANFVDYLLAGLGLFLPVFVITLVVVFGSILLGAVPMVLGAVFDEPELGSVAGMLMYVFALFAAIMVATVTTAPLQASLARAMHGRQVRGEKIGFGSAYATISVDVVPIIGLTFAQIGLTLLGAMMCYFPALLVAIALGFALPAMIVHRLGVADAIRLSVKHTLAYPVWHLGFFALGFVILFVGQNVPIIGPLLSLPFWLGYTLRGYVGVYGSGEAPITA